MGTEILSHLNWLAILVAALAYFLLGALWYSKLLFVNSWIKMLKIDVSDPHGKKGLAQIMLGSFLLMFIASIGLALIISRLGLVTIMSGLKVGLLTGICFSVTAISISYLYEKRPLGLHLINGGYNVAGSIIAGMIIAAWR